MYEESSVDPVIYADEKPGSFEDTSSGRVEAAVTCQSGLVYNATIHNQSNQVTQHVSVGPEIHHVANLAVYQKDIQYNVTNITHTADPTKDPKYITGLIKKLQSYFTEVEELESCVVGLKKPQLVIYPPINKQTINEYLSNSTLPSQSLNIEDICQSEEKSIAIIGESGSGKSTLLRRVCKKINKESLEGNSEDFAVLLELRTLDDPEPKFLHEFFLGDAGRILNDEEKKNMIIWMSENDTRITMLLDGYDQFVHRMPVRNNKNTGCFGRFSEMEFIKAILRKKIFRGSKMFLSSRPFAIKDLPVDCLPTSVVTLGGLLLDDVDLLMDDLGGERVKYSIKSNHQVYYLCTNPLHLCFVVALFNTLGEDFPNTLTGIMLQIVNTSLQLEGSTAQYDKNVDDVALKICNLAHNGIVSHKYIFSSKDLVQYGLSMSDVQLFMTVKKPNSKSILKVKILSENWPMHFTHQKVQALLSAIYLWQSSQTTVQNFLMESNRDFSFSNVVIFLHGMFCNQQNKSILTDVLRGENLEANNCHDLFSESLKNSLQIIDFNKRSEEIVPIYYLRDLLGCVAECDDATVSYLTGDIENVNPMPFQLNAMGLKKMLRNMSTMKTLFLSKITKTHVDQLTSSQATSQVPTMLCRVDSLDISFFNDVIDDSLALLINQTKVQSLRISNGKMSIDGWSNFIHALDEHIKFKDIFLMNMNIRKDMLPDLCKLLSHIEGIILITDNNEDGVKEEIMKASKDVYGVTIKFIPAIVQVKNEATSSKKNESDLKNESLSNAISMLLASLSDFEKHVTENVEFLPESTAGVLGIMNDVRNTFTTGTSEEDINDNVDAMTSVKEDEIVEENNSSSFIEDELD